MWYYSNTSRRYRKGFWVVRSMVASSGKLTAIVEFYFCDKSRWIPCLIASMRVISCSSQYFISLLSVSSSNLTEY